MTRLSEADEQKILVRWLHANDIMFFSVPNEGRRSFANAAQLKAMGLTKGVPDLIIVTPAPDLDIPGYAIPMVVCVELKAAHRKGTKNGGLSPDQILWHKKAAEHGWKTLVAHGAKDAVAKLRGLGYAS